jgi:hypothetical protein
MSIYTLAQKFGPELIDRFKNPIQANHERFTTTPDDAGGQDKAWSVISAFDIAILPKGGSDSFTTDRIESNTSVIAYAKYSDLSGFVSGDRITHDDRVYRVADHFDIAKAKAAIKLICDDGKAA